MKHALNQICTHWAKTGVDEDGKDVFAAPVEFLARWEDRSAKFQENNGDERISNAVIYVDNFDLLSIGDFVAEGSVPLLGTTNLSVRSVRAKNRVKSINAKDQLVKIYCQ